MGGGEVQVATVAQPANGAIPPVPVPAVWQVKQVLVAPKAPASALTVPAVTLDPECSVAPVARFSLYPYKPAVRWHVVQVLAVVSMCPAGLPSPVK